MSVEHWMSFGTFAQKNFFVYPRPDTYSGVVINANMATHAPGGLAAFLLERTGGLNYIIDPLTHAFQHRPSAIMNDAGEPKKAIRKLADLYGDPVAKIVGNRRLSHKDLMDDGVLREMVTKCISFQHSHLATYMRDSPAAKYLGDEAEQPPYAVVAPYFYLTETTLDEWLPVNVRSAELAAEVAAEMGITNVYSACVADQGVILDPEARTRVVTEMGRLPVKGFLLWIDALDEAEANVSELRGLRILAAGLRGAGLQRDVLNLHGGYFSILAAGNAGLGAMSGVAHGPEFGEHRGVVPVGGGIPISRYYIWQLHIRVRYREALSILQEKGWLASAEVFHDNVCDCRECREVLDGHAENFTRFGEGTVKSVRRKHGLVRIEYPTSEARLRCLRHYLQRKNREYEFSRNAPRDVALASLSDDAAPLASVLGVDGVAHLSRWRKVLEEIPG